MDAGRAGTGLRQGPGAVPDRAPDRRRCRNRIGGWRDQAELAAPARRRNPRLTWADPPPAWSAGDRVCGLQLAGRPGLPGSARPDVLDRLDRNLPLRRRRPLRLEVNDHLKDALVIASLDVLLIRAGWQRDVPGKGSVAELRVVLVLGMFVPVCLDGQDAARHLHIKLLLRVEAGKLGAHHVAAVLDVVLHPHCLGGHRVEHRQRGLQPVEEIGKRPPVVLARERTHRTTPSLTYGDLHFHRIAPAPAAVGAKVVNARDLRAAHLAGRRPPPAAWSGPACTGSSMSTGCETGPRSSFRTTRDSSTGPGTSSPTRPSP